MDSTKPMKLPRARYFDKDMFYDISTHIVVEDFPLHWHDFYELEFVCSGQAVQVINGTVYESTPGTSVLLTPADFHSYRLIPGKEPLEMFNVKFSDLILPEQIRTELCAFQGPLVCSNEKIRPILDSILDEYQKNDHGRDQFIRAGITQLCILLLRSGRENGILSDGMDYGASASVQQAVLYIRNHYRGPITVEEVAKVVHLTPNYFSEFFKKQTGIKFSSYVQKMRLEFAASLLQMSDLSVKQVADASGFNSAAYFSNAFKENFGISPEQFRKNHLNTRPNAQ
jgi:AraC-like DNA-binding protein